MPIPRAARKGHAVVSLVVCWVGLLAAPMRAEDDVPRRITPERIITISPNSAEIICELGACDRIVGVDKFCVYPPPLLHRPRVGGLFDPDLEKIVALRPDLVVLRGHSDALERLCASLEIRIYHDRTETLADVSVCITELGRLLDREAQAVKLVDAFHARIAAIRKRVAGRPRPRVFLTYSLQPDRIANVLTAGKGMFLSEMLEIAGGFNVFGHLDMRYPQISTEAIVAQRPDIILQLIPEIEPTDALQEQVLDLWRKLGPIPAVENNRVYILTDDHCLIPSPRYVEIIEKVSRLIHPEPVGEQPTKSPVKP